MISCNEQNKPNIPVQSNKTESTPQSAKEDEEMPVFEKYENEGLILVDKFELLDDSLKPVKKLSTDKIVPVKIIARSKNKHFRNQNDNDCLKANYLKIIYDGETYIVFGRFVYETDPQKFSVTIKDSKLEILSIKNFEMGAGDEEGLTGCDDYSIIVIKRLEDNNYSLIQNPKERKPYTGEQCDYAVLLHDEGGSEKIYNVSSKEDSISILIKAYYQEGGGSYKFNVLYNENLSKGSINNYIRYEENELDKLKELK
jgi:hypothetical protein